MDRYDQDIAYLTANPASIDTAWMNPAQCHGGSLFGFATADREPGVGPDGRVYGCLTTIRSRLGAAHVAQTPDLTTAIRLDERIPAGCSCLTLESLPVFAEWQRRIDAELGREPLPFDDRIPMPDAAA